MIFNFERNREQKVFVSREEVDEKKGRKKEEEEKNSEKSE
jgi:hypothetical protein